MAGRLRGAVAWVAVMVAALNFMHAGANKEPCIPTLSVGPAISEQMEVINRLYLDADVLLGGNSVQFSSRAWEAEMHNLRMDYDGVSVAKAMDLTLEQVIPALPAPGLAASVDALRMRSCLPFCLKPFRRNNETSCTSMPYIICTCNHQQCPCRQATGERWRPSHGRTKSRLSR